MRTEFIRYSRSIVFNNDVEGQADALPAAIARAEEEHAGRGRQRQVEDELVARIAEVGWTVVPGESGLGRFQKESVPTPQVSVPSRE